jgi:Family of unknown function (DUF6113)
VSGGGRRTLRHAETNPAKTPPAPAGVAAAAAAAVPADRWTTRPLPTYLVVLGMVIYAAVGVLSATLEILLVPLRSGTVLIPVAVVLAVGGNIALAFLGRDINGSVSGALPPIIAWIVTLVVLMSTRPEGDVLLPGGNDQWVSYGVMVGGLFSGLISVLVLSSKPRRRRPTPAQS